MQYYYHFLFFITLLIHLHSLNLTAQGTSFQQYGLKEGLSSSNVYSTIEDDTGFLWVATSAGVDRFDGDQFKHYSLPNFKEIRKSIFYRFFMKVDKEKNLWLLANNGYLFQYSKDKDAFILFHKLIDKYGNNIGTSSLYIDNNDKFWIGSLHGVIMFDTVSKQLELHKDVKGAVHSITSDDNQNLYIGGNKGIFVLDKNYKLKYNLVDVCPTPNIDFEEGRIRSMYFEENYKRLWIGSDKRGLCAFNIKDYQFISPEATKHLKGLAIRSINNFGSENIIVSVDGFGLLVMDSYKFSIQNTFSYKENDSKSLKSNSIFDIYQNKDGIFFISTFRGGLNSYNPNQLKINTQQKIIGNPNSLEDNYVISMKEIEENVIAFGTAKGVSIWNRNTDQWTHLSTLSKENNLLNRFIHDITVDEKKNMWVTSFTDKITVYPKLNNKTYGKPYKINTNKQNSSIFGLHLEENENLYFTNIERGLYAYNLKKDTLKLYPKRGLEKIESITRFKLALGGSSGFWILDLLSGEFMKPDFIASSRLNDQIINSIYKSPQGQFWVGTADEGVFVVDFINKSVESISTANGLPSNTIFSIVSSELFTWVSSPKGISRIDRKRNIYNLYKSDGLVSIDFNKNAAIYGKDGILYFGTNDGVISFSPRDIHPIEGEKKLIFTEFYINHQLTQAGEGATLRKNINEMDQIVLTNSQNSFGLEIRALDFIHPRSGKVEWKLEGLDKTWISYGNTERINYTNISPGHYTLRVRVVNQKGELLANSKEIAIEVKPPLWRSNIALIMYAVVLILLIIAIIRFSKVRIDSKKSEDRLHFLINMAHEIKTPLTLIKAPLQDLLTNDDFSPSIKQNLKIALDSADKLQKQMLQFLDFRRIKAQGNPIITENTDMIQFFQDKVFAFKVLCKRKDIQMNFSSSISEFNIQTDRKIIDVIVSNLISNAIKYTEEKGKININMNIKDEHCEISVVDTGIGIPKSQQKKIFNLFYRTPEARDSGISGSGVGLVLAFDLAKRLNGKLALTESSQKGSTFTFSFPYRLSSNTVSADAVDIEEQNQEEENINSNKIKLLLVEDDKSLRDYTKNKLQEKYHVFTAVNGKEALEITSKNMPDIVVSDVSMPKMNGRQLTMNLKGNLDTCHIPVILLTGLSSKENVLQGLDSGADEYLTKPVEFDVLMKRIDSILENRQIIKRKFIQVDEIDTLELTNELDKTFIDEINTYIDENISDSELSVYDLYEITGMSRTPFYHKLKAIVDMSPSEYIRSMRLKKAMSLLRDPRNSVSEVAYSVGFSNPKNFSTSFKKHFGKSPSAFIAEIRDKKGMSVEEE